MNFFAWVDKDLNRLKKINIILGLVIFLIISLLIIIIFFISRGIQLEESCREKAQNIVEDKWGILLDPNPDEYGFIPPKKGNKITLGFREQLRCERNTPLFHKLD